MAGPAWTQVIVRLGRVDDALASDRLWVFGPAAVEERPGEVAGDDRPALLVAAYEDPERAASAGAAVEELGVASVHLRPVDDDGLDAWRAWARVEQAGPFTLVPAWLPVPEPASEPSSGDRPDRHVIVLDPARTFGSGSHPTTRLVLALLARTVDPGDRVLDVGCGSGVLSVGAALLGAAETVGIDVDPEAPPTTRANAEANGVGHLVTAGDDDLASVVASGARFDVVAANLLAPVVAELAGDLVGALAEGGCLVVSGVLTERWEESAAVLAPLPVREAVHEGGWTAFVVGRP